MPASSCARGPRGTEGGSGRETPEGGNEEILSIVALYT